MDSFTRYARRPDAVVAHSTTARDWFAALAVLALFVLAHADLMVWGD